jgi:2-polyprenyl-3-methyl-5-hydroxy-6-metoxy-1,4-benzoquinol methylase
LSELNTPIGWDNRYNKDGTSASASGTYEHSDAGNRQFYKVKKRAINGILTSSGSTFRGKRILDAAGGTGYFIDYFLKRDASHVSLYDFSRTAIDIVSSKWKHNGKVTAYNINLACHEGFPEQDFDFCFVMEAIFLLESDDDFFQAMINIANCVSSNGTIIISDIFPEKRIKNNAYVTRRSKLEFEGTLKSLGFNKFEYYPQTYLFNRRIFGPFQKLLESSGSLLYWLDRIALCFGMRPAKESASDIKYLVAQR